MTSTLQEISRKRNFAKGYIQRMLNLIKDLKNTSKITKNESVKIIKVEKTLLKIVANWEEEWRLLKLTFKK